MNYVKIIPNSKNNYDKSYWSNSFYEVEAFQNLILVQIMSKVDSGKNNLSEQPVSIFFVHIEKKWNI